MEIEAEECRGKETYREYMSETISISASACAIFCSLEICGWRPKRKDILIAWEVFGAFNVSLAKSEASA